jgi:putative cofactor-binding repeat protein
LGTNQFDQLAKSLVSVSTRRRLVGHLAALPWGAALATLLAEKSEAGRRRRRKARHHPGDHKQTRKGKRKGQKQQQKCSGCTANQLCVDGVCKSCDVCASGCAHPSVQAAILDPDLVGTHNEAVVHVCAGPFIESIAIDQIRRMLYSVTVIGAGSGPDGTILHGAGGSVVNITGPASEQPSLFVALQGLRVTGGDGEESDAGGVTARWSEDAGSLTLTDCVVTENQGGTGGGVFTNNGGLVTLNACTVSNNRSADTGGGVNNFDGTVVLNDCTMTGNHAENGGGGIFNFGGQTTLKDTSVTGNVVENAMGSGGGILNMGGMVTLKGSTKVTGNTPNNCAGTGITGSGCSA